MLKNDTLKNGTSRVGLYGSAPRSRGVVTFGSIKPKQIESHVVEIELPLKDGTPFNLTANVISEITGFIH